MKLLYNLIPIQPLRSKRHGGGRYGEAVIKYIIINNINVVCVYDSEKWINPEIIELISSRHVILYDINSINIPSIIEKENIQVYYTPLISKDTIGEWNCKMVGTIHGLRSIEMPADYMYCKYKGINNICLFLAYKFAGFMIRKVRISRLNRILSMKNFFPVTVSNYSSSQIKRFFSLEKPLLVCYSPSTYDKDNIVNRVYTEKYYLMVSAFVPFKNGLRAIMAFDNLFDKGELEGVRVKITGIDTCHKYRYKIRNRKRFDFLGFVNDQKLEQLYHDAYCLIYPSLNEGFGYPPIEAMHYGVPVIASHATSIPEVCGEAALYFNPFSIEEMMDKIKLIEQESVREAYCERTIKQYQIIHQRQERDLKVLIDYMCNG